MENLDIEKLSREMPYKMPDNTFEIMQNNVLAKTLNKKQAPIFNLKWFYSAAAVILIVVGVSFFINSNLKKDGSKSIELTSNVDNTPQNNRSKGLAFQGNEVAQKSGDLQTDEVQDTADLTSEPVSHLNVKKQMQDDSNLVASKQTKINPPTDAQIDGVLDGFSSSEIASLSNNTEQDVYLDLYN